MQLTVAWTPGNTEGASCWLLIDDEPLLMRTWRLTVLDGDDSLKEPVLHVAGKKLDKKLEVTKSSDGRRRTMTFRATLKDLVPNRNKLFVQKVTFLLKDGASEVEADLMLVPRLQVWLATAAFVICVVGWSLLSLLVVSGASFEKLSDFGSRLAGTTAATLAVAWLHERLTGGSLPSWGLRHRLLVALPALAALVVAAFVPGWTLRRVTNLTGQPLTFPDRDGEPEVVKGNETRLVARWSIPTDLESRVDSDYEGLILLGKSPPADQREQETIGQLLRWPEALLGIEELTVGCADDKYAVDPTTTKRIQILDEKCARTSRVKVLLPESYLGNYAFVGAVSAEISVPWEPRLRDGVVLRLPKPEPSFTLEWSSGAKSDPPKPGWVRLRASLKQKLVFMPNGTLATVTEPTQPAQILRVSRVPPDGASLFRARVAGAEVLSSSWTCLRNDAVELESTIENTAPATNAWHVMPDGCSSASWQLRLGAPSGSTLTIDLPPELKLPQTGKVEITMPSGRLTLDGSIGSIQLERRHIAVAASKWGAVSAEGETWAKSNAAEESAWLKRSTKLLSKPFDATLEESTGNFRVPKAPDCPKGKWSRDTGRCCKGEIRTCEGGFTQCDCES